MRKVKSILKRNLKNFLFFYKRMGKRIFVMIVLTLSVGLMDGMGLTMFLPLFQIASGISTGADIPANNTITSLIQHIHLDIDLWNILCLMVIFYTVKGVLNYFKIKYDTDTGRYFMLKTRKRLLYAFNTIQYKYFVSTDAGRIQNVMTGELTTVYHAFVQYINITQQGIMVMIYLGFALWINTQFALFISVGAALFNFVFRYIYTITKESSRRRVTAANRYQGLVIQAIGNFKYLKTTGLFNRYTTKINDSIDAIELENRKIGYMGAITSAIREPILILIVSAVILLQVYGFGGELSTIIVSLLFFYRALTAVTLLQMSLNTFNGMTGTLENVDWFEKELQANKEYHMGSKKLTTLRDGLTLQHVNFYYDNRHTIKNLNLKIPANTTVALVGESGSGKTTVINLLCGLLPLNEGTYLIDNIPFNEIDINHFQNQIGYISQDPVIFNDTVYNNVTFWAEQTETNIAGFNDALRKAAILEYVNTLPLQGNTVLGNNGMNISGGQKQRIAIARELFKKAQILVFDEATSALDSETERIIQDNIDCLKGYYTIIIIAHRIATIRNVDRIFYIREGEVISEGAFEELLEIAPMFKKMVESQII